MTRIDKAIAGMFFAAMASTPTLAATDPAQIGASVRRAMDAVGRYQVIAKGSTTVLRIAIDNRRRFYQISGVVQNKMMSAARDEGSGVDYVYKDGVWVPIDDPSGANWKFDLRQFLGHFDRVEFAANGELTARGEISTNDGPAKPYAVRCTYDVRTYLLQRCTDQSGFISQFGEYSGRIAPRTSQPKPKPSSTSASEFAE